LGAEIRKEREPDERLCRGTESNRLADERVDLRQIFIKNSELIQLKILLNEL